MKTRLLDTKGGFTIIELMIIIGIIFILVFLMTTFFTSALSENELKNTGLIVVDFTRRAQRNAMHRRTPGTWGVHLETSKVVFFKGAVYSGSDPDNEVYNIPGVVTLSPISLNGGGSELLFSQESGSTSQYGSVTMNNTQTGATSLISINEAGRVNY